ncbi:MAG: sigma-54 dependent transcriptional regulator [Nitrospira sp.]|nr:sigma-54 dependent transcriptional regulator [Nitrospira sp.]
MIECHTDEPGTESSTVGESILVVDDDPSMRAALVESVRRLGFPAQGAIDGADALERVARLRPWLVLTDLKMPRVTGLDLIKEIKRRAPHASIVLMTAYGSVETAVEAMKLGASDYLMKPFSMDVLARIIMSLKEGREAEPSGRGGMPDHRPIVTQDPGMIRLLSTVETIAASQATVLINGESGTGKELLARFIHSRSPRAHRPFIAVNCAALPDGLLESELFGHERGAFTGAVIRKIGKFEMAHTGTLLLDEIGEMTLGLQAKLLRVLQEREVDRVGGREPVPVNIRVIATTNRALHREVEQNRFREDLYYRLNVFPVTIPPLRERPGDIPMLARYFAAKAAARNGIAQPSISESTLAYLQRLPWKGNVRELENVIERAVLLAGEGPILPDHCLLEVRETAGASSVPTPVSQPSANGSLWEMERELIFKTLARVNDNRTKAAKELGISIRTLRNKLREYRDGGQSAQIPTS